MTSPLYVAELTINHLGMLNIAKAMIKAAKKSGADFVKLKKKKVDQYYKKDVQQWRSFDFLTYRQSLELSDDDFFELDKYCKEIGIQWFSTIHEAETLEFIQQFNPPMYKIASMDAGKDSLVQKTIEQCQKHNVPLVISLGGKDEIFVETLLKKIHEAEIFCFLLHTVSIYPTPSGKSNINYINDLIKKYENDRVRVGYSGHEEGYAPTLLATSYGAKMIERHFTLTRDYNIHHINAALTPGEFKDMVRISREMLMEKNAQYQVCESKEQEFLNDLVYN
jgi:N-acetylneuraminate synthase